MKVSLMNYCDISLEFQRIIIYRYKFLGKNMTNV